MWFYTAQSCTLREEYTTNTRSNRCLRQLPDLLRSTRRIGRLAIGNFLGTRSVGRLAIGHLLSAYGIEARAVGRGLRIARRRLGSAQLCAARPRLTATCACWHCNGAVGGIDAALLDTPMVCSTMEMKK